ncbi:UvrD-helicase domain-containing protein [Xanthomonas rydalmerensis]|uniref:DNA 3'-5' helicase II n=1 Tax=Xanthomonas rydalmerensis TaxID=3046274 RepID=A0ABZ0JH91_9XANT|nr:UvrD-helicase domain-containing protein [Xanthomonas sp. DM-2023]WOS39145.1 AAA family ATPase [Xanthomonas sp. DM-2023]WOS43328.1 AAA family ATPase [Xanthomonas sp. DM-2023]WOS47508.1 AAA family ATPase [Xanthomonas sp. DM-2023]WOS51688.1 AAA family ATPase [Xanthomonas sp. DM-2023]WOS55871.1 AAA family ATPase [Xanthomonas sp. DM-2023]
MKNPLQFDENDIDKTADAVISQCLNPESPRSFFLFAGAGSGKTRSLVTALEHVQKNWGEGLRRQGKRVGVITFTNAASDEIKRRIQFDALFDVRTIHSFAWSLIEGLNHDIREWLKVKIAEDLAELRAKEAKGRAGKASDERKFKIAAGTKRLEVLPKIKTFIYSPTGTNRTKDALNHSEVIRIAAHFLQTKDRMQSIFVGRYPILLVDESQDTNKNLIDALFEVESKQSGAFSLGLIGDTMQQIYADGKEDLGKNLPTSWKTPGKQMNHRCPKRVVDLLNKVRASVDSHQQRARTDAIEGVVRLFIVPSSVEGKIDLEDRIAGVMADLTGDDNWRVQEAVKTLTLEHRMAAARLGCLDVFAALYEIDSTSLLNGTLQLATFFTEQVLPLIKAHQNDDRFSVMRLLKEFSPLLTADKLKGTSGQSQLKIAKSAVDALASLWADGQDPSLQDVLILIAELRLLEVPERLAARTAVSDEQNHEEEASEDGERQKRIDELLATPFSQIAPLASYLSRKARFDTHQGVKGLEFERVMVIMDDQEARGFMFKYEDLFGRKTEGKTLEATRRLFYVTASRAMKSLALVAYTEDVMRVKRFILENAWFSEDEVVTIA